MGGELSWFQTVPSMGALLESCTSERQVVARWNLGRASRDEVDALECVEAVDEVRFNPLPKLLEDARRRGLCDACRGNSVESCRLTRGKR